MTVDIGTTTNTDCSDTETTCCCTTSTPQVQHECVLLATPPEVQHEHATGTPEVQPLETPDYLWFGFDFPNYCPQSLICVKDKLKAKYPKPIMLFNLFYHDSEHQLHEWLIPESEVPNVKTSTIGPFRIVAPEMRCSNTNKCTRCALHAMIVRNVELNHGFNECTLLTFDQIDDHTEISNKLKVSELIYVDHRPESGDRFRENVLAQTDRPRDWSENTISFSRNNINSTELGALNGFCIRFEPPKPEPDAVAEGKQSITTSDIPTDASTDSEWILDDRHYPQRLFSSMFPIQKRRSSWKMSGYNFTLFESVTLPKFLIDHADLLEDSVDQLLEKLQLTRESEPQTYWVFLKADKASHKLDNNHLWVYTDKSFRALPGVIIDTIVPTLAMIPSITDCSSNKPCKCLVHAPKPEPKTKIQLFAPVIDQLKQQQQQSDPWVKNNHTYQMWQTTVPEQKHRASKPPFEYFTLFEKVVLPKFLIDFSNSDRKLPNGFDLDQLLAKLNLTRESEPSSYWMFMKYDTSTLRSDAHLWFLTDTQFRKINGVTIDALEPQFGTIPVMSHCNFGEPCECLHHITIDTPVEVVVPEVVPTPTPKPWPSHIVVTLNELLGGFPTKFFDNQENAPLMPHIYELLSIDVTQPPQRVWVMSEAGNHTWNFTDKQVIERGGEFYTQNRNNELIQCAGLPKPLECIMGDRCTRCRAKEMLANASKSSPVAQAVSEPMVTPPISEPTVVVEQIQTPVVPISLQNFKLVPTEQSSMTFELRDVFEIYGRELSSDYHRNLQTYFGVSSSEDSYEIFVHNPAGHGMWHLLRETVIAHGGTINEKVATIKGRFECVPEQRCTWCIFHKNQSNMIPNVRPVPDAISEPLIPVVPTQQLVVPKQKFDLDPRQSNECMKFEKVDIYTKYSAGGMEYHKNLRKYFGVTRKEDSYSIWRYFPSSHGYWHLLEETVLAYGGTINGCQAIIPGQFKCTPEHQCTECIFTTNSIDTVPVIRRQQQQPSPIIPEQSTPVVPIIAPPISEPSVIVDKTPTPVVSVLPLQKFTFDVSCNTHSTTIKKLDIWDSYMDSGNPTGYGRKIGKYFGVTSKQDSYSIWLYNPCGHGFWHLLEETLIAHGGKINGDNATIMGRFKCTDTHKCTNCMLDALRIEDVPVIRRPVPPSDTISEQLTTPVVPIIPPLTIGERLKSLIPKVADYFDKYGLTDEQIEEINVKLRDEIAYFDSLTTREQFDKLSEARTLKFPILFHNNIWTRHGYGHNVESDGIRVAITEFKRITGPLNDRTKYSLIVPIEDIHRAYLDALKRRDDLLIVQQQTIREVLLSEPSSITEFKDGSLIFKFSNPKVPILNFNKDLEIIDKFIKNDTSIKETFAGQKVTVSIGMYSNVLSQTEWLNLKIDRP